MIIHQPLFSRFGFGILNNASKKMLELMEIYFDVNNKSKSGKWIPLDKDTALPHSSSNSINSQPCTLSCQLISTSNDQIQSKLDSLGLKLPQPLKALPNVKTPSAWIRIWKDKAYISGHGPQNPDGSIAGPFGKVGTKDISVEQGYESAKLACLSILGTLKRELGSLDKVVAWLQVRVMVNTVEGFTKTTDVANGFSDLIVELYGPDAGVHARSAIGVQALPVNLPVIIDAVVEVIA
jgi:enamine deaminase RidA (YjgF/YER057c/UK114 family)